MNFSEIGDETIDACESPSDGPEMIDMSNKGRNAIVLPSWMGSTHEFAISTMS